MTDYKNSKLIYSLNVCQFIARVFYDILDNFQWKNTWFINFSQVVLFQIIQKWF